MEKRQKVTIVLLNLNGKADTLECLASLKKLEGRKARTDTIVVDNGSTDDSVPAISRQFPDVLLIENKKNLGFCEGNNIGVKQAFANGADSVLILNNDTLIHPELVDQLVAVAQKRQAAIVSPKIYFARGFEFHKDRYREAEKGRVIWYAGGKIDWNNVWPSHRGVDEVDHGQFDDAYSTEFATGCAMLVSRALYEKIGLFDPVFFAYFEDADLSIRAPKSGFTVMFAPKAILWHKNAASFGGSGSPFQDYFITRNRLLFGLRHASLRAKIALLREGTKFLIKGPWTKRNGIIDALLRRMPDIEKLREQTGSTLEIKKTTEE
ncbi:MAG: hypothetical protein A2900_03145 [Candidatus Chisholmbacteria bacterium RIFCSPLOWO2_01_FULL_50_28]|uniref:Glycosyltransferase 2-like domain-containing protein n=1 Tax=Candidatus Chisholmbacteria bacterium RIFCSPHIGHO2_01_FULL_52_32 TaxID=1797591 RepID=A0A1G1VTM8_9BACT|nr:MAG: hypothetical protein A2786_03600 [Candidatus Chisholmbacteria bacterium RIFCSPHIGHO2_01_FULL_52_32]OGY20072.1 MAG: hypothetical protein A2900_03145 [Candidatus Chisholmbacteria bacterium RIFCSPLOWO2_01_FULL_50_28]